MPRPAQRRAGGGGGAAGCRGVPRGGWAGNHRSVDGHQGCRRCDEGVPAVTEVVVAGIDGGASSTTCVVIDSAGRVLGTGRGGPIDHLYKPSGRAQTRRVLRDALSSARGARKPHVPLRAVVAGLTGVEPRSDESRTAARMIRELTRAP